MKFKKPESAVRAYKKYLEKNPDNGIAKFVGEQALAQKNYPEAVKYLGMVGGDDAKSPQFMLMYGNTCFLAKEDAKALQIYKQLAVSMPQNADVFHTLYELTLRSGTKEEALTYLKKYADLGILPIIELHDLTYQYGHNAKSGPYSDGNDPVLFANTITHFWTRADVAPILI